MIHEDITDSSVRQCYALSWKTLRYLACCTDKTLDEYLWCQTDVVEGWGCGVGRI